MLTDLDETGVERDQRGARVVHAAASGLGPLIGRLVPLSPFPLEGSVLTIAESGLVGVGLGVGVLAVLGAYTGSISGQRWYVAAG